MTKEELIKEIEAQRNLLISVATGGPLIREVKLMYEERRERIAAALQERGMADPNPFTDLWEWHGKWKSGELPSYFSRQQYINKIFGPPLNTLKGSATYNPVDIFDNLTGWEKVDDLLRGAVFI